MKKVPLLINISAIIIMVFQSYVIIHQGSSINKCNANRLYDLKTTNKYLKEIIKKSKQGG